MGGISFMLGMVSLHLQLLLISYSDLRNIIDEWGAIGLYFTRAQQLRLQSSQIFRKEQSLPQNTSPVTPPPNRQT